MEDSFQTVSVKFGYHSSVLYSIKHVAELCQAHTTKLYTIKFCCIVPLEFELWLTDYLCVQIICIQNNPMIRCPYFLSGRFL